MITAEKFTYEEVLGLKFGYSPWGKPRMHTHIYYVDGLLIDTGQPGAQKRILTETEALHIDRIFITHHHEDHSGNIPVLKKANQCEAFASPNCCQIMKDPPKLSLAQKLTWGSRPAYHGLIPVEDHLETEHHRFQIIPIPGHAPDMVALYEPQKQWLFSADLFINPFIGYFKEDERIAQQIASTKAILELDFKVMFCSHNPQFDDPREQLVKKLEFLRSSFDSVASLHAKGYSSKAIFKELGWKENRFVKALSGGKLSRLNMVRSIVRDIETDISSVQAANQHPF